MKKENIIKILIGVLILVLLIILGIGVNKYTLNKNSSLQDNENKNKEDMQIENQNKEESGEKLQELEFNNESGEKKEVIELQKIKLSDFTLENLGDSIKINGKVENISEEAVTDTKLIFELLDFAGVEILEYKMEISEKIEPKEIRNVETIIGFSNENIKTLNVKLDK